MIQMTNIPQWKVLEDLLPVTFSGEILEGMYTGSKFYISDIFLTDEMDIEFKIVVDVMYDNIKIGISKLYNMLNEYVFKIFLSHIEDLPIDEVSIKK